LNCISERENPPCFQQSQWSSILKAVQTEKANQARQEGAHLVKAHDLATEQEQELLAVACLWERSYKCADFFAMNKMLYHLVARCCEAAQQKKSNLSVVEKSEGFRTYKCLSVPVDRHKTSTKQQLQIFPHKTSCLMCFYFSLAYKMVLDNGTSDYLFPEFAKKLGNSNENKIDSKASGLFNEYLKYIQGISEKYEQHVSYDGDDVYSTTRSLTSHSVGKKGKSLLNKFFFVHILCT